jgi:hypothetical protein
VDVAVTVLPQVVFTEPVRRVVPGGLVLVNDTKGTTEAIDVAGMGVDGAVIPNLDTASVVTAVTVKPRAGLEFWSSYRLEVGAPIEDLDTDATGAPAPKPMAPYTLEFTTFKAKPFGAHRRSTDPRASRRSPSTWRAARPRGCSISGWTLSTSAPTAVPSR